MIIFIVNIYFIIKQFILKKFKKEVFESNNLKIKITILEIVALVIIGNFFIFDVNIKERYIPLMVIDNNTFQTIIELEKNINTNTLGYIEKIFNYEKSLEIFLGLVSVVIAIYIYCMSIADSFKRNILLILIGSEDILLKILLIVFLYFINVPSFLFIGLILVIFYQSYEIIAYMFKVSIAPSSKHKDIFQSIDYKLSNDSIIDLYMEIKKCLYGAILEGNIAKIEELKEYYLWLLNKGYIESLKINLISKDEKNRLSKDEKNYEEVTLQDSYYFIYSILKNLIDNPNDSVYYFISDLNISAGDLLIKSTNYNEAYNLYSLIVMKYKYYLKSILIEKDKEDIKNLKFEIFSGFRFFEDRDYYKKAKTEEEKININIVFYEALVKVFDEVIKKYRKDDFKEFLIILSLGHYDCIQPYKNGETRRIINDYMSFVLMYLLEKKDVKEIFKDSYKELKKLTNIISAKNLEKIYEMDEKYKLEKRLKLYRLFFKEDNIFGMGGGTYSTNNIREIILKKMNMKAWGISEEFIRKNFEILESKCKDLKLDNILERIEEIKTN